MSRSAFCLPCSGASAPPPAPRSLCSCGCGHPDPPPPNERAVPAPLGLRERRPLGHWRRRPRTYVGTVSADDIAAVYLETRTAARRRAERIGNAFDAEDALQNAVLQMLERRESLYRATSGYLVKAAAYAALEMARRRDHMEYEDTPTLERLALSAWHRERGGRKAPRWNGQDS